MMVDKKGYKESIEEVEKILERLSSEQFDVDLLAAEVARATELIAHCKSRLTKVEQSVAKIVEAE